MNFFILSLFPQIFDPVTSFSILKRAKDKKVIKIIPINIRDFAKDKHKITDLPPYGGGAGMILKPEPIFSAVEYVINKYKLEKDSLEIILLSASGKPFTQERALSLSFLKNIILICGHYEGVDERVAKYLTTQELSIGNYIVSGGEYPALILVDAISRLIPNVLENKESLKTESFQNGVVEYPQYTRPEVYNRKKVPSILLSGNHEEIEKWRIKESKRKTNYSCDTTSL
ncbi:MAG: tRNA (guanosine(37)-N1)-methyltransferase TrmD [bacterium]